VLSLAPWVNNVASQQARVRRETAVVAALYWTELLIFPQNALILLVGETGTLCEWCITGPRISGI
jgi:hypothetical protein